MPNLHLLFSHQFTPQQQKNVYSELGIDDIQYLPENLQKVWSGIPPEYETDMSKVLEPFVSYLKQVIQQGDFVLIQGDYGAVYYMVSYCFKNGLIPIYATTERVVISEKKENGEVIIKRVFKHVSFRKYQPF